MHLTTKERANWCLRRLSLKDEYNTEDDDVVESFYTPCFRVSKRYDRAVGYFRANIYRELGENLLDFALNGGKTRIVCSPDIPEPDEMAAREGYELRGKRNIVEFGQDLVEVMKAMEEDPEEADCLSMLRLLIEDKSLDLFIALRPHGIYHRKTGLFGDADSNYVTFSGSSNETNNAVATAEDWGNDEAFDVFRSWGDAYESKKARNKQQYLEQLFAGGTANSKVRSLNEVERGILEKFRLHRTLEGCRPGASKRSRKSKKAQATRPYYYQQLAIDAWKNAGHVGILSMATGTGKTLTALFAIEATLTEGTPVLIVVPSNILLDQWLQAVMEVYPEAPVLLGGAGHHWWSESNKRMFVADLKKPRLLLATMQTASSEDFLAFFSQAKSPALVADEVHRLGAPVNRRILSIDFSQRLGLSATPERLFDPEGNEALSRAFGEVPVFNLPIEANVRLSSNDTNEVPILGTFLCRYYYYFETVDLNSEELEEWNEITEEIRRFIVRNKSSQEGSIKPLDEKLTLLLVRRARIAKNASGKIDVATKVIKEKYPANGRWIIYCDNEEQLNKVDAKLRIDFPHFTVLRYHSKMPMKQRNLVLDAFEKNPGIIVSIRCLDEGVDIPNADGALILASSTNPREYIQRRGRVLRQAKKKRFAVIVDTIVQPSPDVREDEIPLSIVRSELARAWEFANHAENSEITHDLWKLCTKFNVNIENDRIIGMEEDYEEE